MGANPNKIANKPKQHIWTHPRSTWCVFARWILAPQNTFFAIFFPALNFSEKYVARQKNLRQIFDLMMYQLFFVSTGGGWNYSHSKKRGFSEKYIQIQPIGV